MQKLDYNILVNLSKVHVTGNELSVLLHIAQYQDEFGCIRGIHYKEVCETLHISLQGFYDALAGLKSKKIISYQRKNSDYDINIFGNNKKATNNWEHGYISMKYPLFKSEKFSQLPVNARLLLIYLLRNNSIKKLNVQDPKSHSMQIKRDKFLADYKEMFKVSKKTIIGYLTKLKPFMSVYLENGRKYFFTLHEEYFSRNINQKTENDILREQQVHSALRRSRIKENQKDSNLIKKLSVFHEYIKNKANFDFSAIVEKSISLQNKCKNKYRMKRSVSVSLIEEILCSELGIENVRFAKRFDGQIYSY